MGLMLVTRAVVRLLARDETAARLLEELTGCGGGEPTDAQPANMSVRRLSDTSRLGVNVMGAA